jgi:flagellar protein FliS
MNADANAAARAYRERAIEGASPARIVRMLLEAALRKVERAGALDAADPRSGWARELQAAEEIVTELRLAIDPSQAAEVAARTEALYDFAAARLRDALAQRAIAPALEARQALLPLADAWRAIDEGRA